MKPHLLGSLVLLCIMPVAQAQQTFGYVTVNNAVTITAYFSTNSSVIIPSTINGLPVTGIGGPAFEASGVTNVSFPNSLTNIGDNAFMFCHGLETVTFGTGPLVIGNGSFSSCGFQSLTIPGNVVSLGVGAFSGNTNLASLTIFNGVTSIGEAAFGNAYSLTNATIPASVTNLPGNPFPACTALTAINVATNNPAFTGVGGILYDLNQTALLGYPAGLISNSCRIPDGVTSIGVEAFSGCTNLVKVIIPGGVTNIGNSAFLGDSRLTNMAIPASVIDLGSDVLANCTGLQAIEVDPENLVYTTVNGVLFDKSETTLFEYPASNGLNSYSIPNGVTNIADYAFSQCGTLTNFTFPAGLVNIGNNAFAYCSNLTAADLLPGLVSIGNYAFYDNPALSSLALPEGITSLGASCFAACGKLGDAMIPASVTNMGIGAFFDSGLTNVMFEAGFSSIGMSAFTGCLSLTSVSIPGSVTNIGLSAFSFSGLTNVTFTDGLTIIGASAFADCANLTRAIVPASVTNIGQGAFIGDSRLAGIYFEGNAPQIGTLPPPFSSTMAFPPTIAFYLPGKSGWVSTLGGVSTALWKPVLQTADGFFGLRSGQFGFNISWASNLTVTVQANNDLTTTNWTALQSCLLTNGTFYFSELMQANAAGRFYRLSWP